MGVPFFWGSLERILLFRVLYWDPPIFGNSLIYYDEVTEGVDGMEVLQRWSTIHPESLHVAAKNADQ